MSYINNAISSNELKAVEKTSDLQTKAQKRPSRKDKQFKQQVGNGHS